MSPFDWLLIGHLVADYLVQVRWMASNKANHWLPLLVHSLIYTLVLTVIAFFSFGGLSIYAILLIFLSHVVLDRRNLVKWWTKNIMGVDLKTQGWLAIVVDQTFHVIVLAVALYLP